VRRKCSAEVLLLHRTMLLSNGSCR
jgi:hypothetical protein